jgi:hypothetical protein
MLGRWCQGNPAGAGGGGNQPDGTLLACKLHIFVVDLHFQHTGK